MKMKLANKYAIILLSIILFTSCNTTVKDDISKYNKSFLSHDNKAFVTLFKLDFSDSIFNNRESLETSKPLILDNETLLVGASNYFYKVNYQKGFVFFKKKLSFSIFGNINLIDDNKIIFFASDGYIYLTDLNLDKVYWKYKLSNESVIGDYKVVGEDIIFKTSKDRLYSLKKKSSALNWVTKSYLSDYMPLNSKSEILINNNRVFSGFSNGKLSVFDIKTGKTLYEDSVTMDESFNDITSSIVINGDMVFIPSYKSGIVSLDVKTKTKNWSTNIAAISKLFVLGEIGIYFSSEEMIKISMKSGKILEKHKLNVENPIDYFLYKNKYIVISSKSEGIYLINVNDLGKSSRIGISSGISIRPIFKNDKLIILTNNSNLYVLKTK